MPLYEYRCSACGHRFESLAKSSNEPAPRCSRCGSKEVKRMVAGFSTGRGSCGPQPTSRPAPRSFG
ncbi:MAG: zinc ribbon domain-containing protein [Chloroflexota bacterium]